MKVISRNILTGTYDKRDDNFPRLNGDVHRLPSYGIFISQFIRFARCCTCDFDFFSLSLQITSNLLTQGNEYHKLRKTFGKFFRSISELVSKLGTTCISFQEYVSTQITGPVIYGDLVYKPKRVKGKANSISSGLKIVKRLRCRRYDPSIIENSIGLVLGHLQP